MAFEESLPTPDAIEDSRVASPPASEQEPSVVPEIDDEWLPIVSKWYDMNNYECPKCPWSTLDADAIATHIYRSHILPNAQGLIEVKE